MMHKVKLFSQNLLKMAEYMYVHESNCGRISEKRGQRLIDRNISTCYK